MPTGYDRLLATRFGAAAITAIENEKWGEMVALQSPNLVTVPIEEVIREEKRVNLQNDIVQAARYTGISLGD
jgi:6-phosphofructokinase 1